MAAPHIHLGMHLSVPADRHQSDDFSDCLKLPLELGSFLETLAALRQIHAHHRRRNAPTNFHGPRRSQHPAEGSTEAMRSAMHSTHVDSAHCAYEATDGSEPREIPVPALPAIGAAPVQVQHGGGGKEPV